MNTTTAPPLLVNLDQTTLSFGSNVDQIHEERGVGGEELSRQYLPSFKYSNRQWTLIHANNYRPTIRVDSRPFVV